MIKTAREFWLAVVLCAAVAGAGQAAEAPPVLMIGDSMMRLLGIAMEKELAAAGVPPGR